MKTKIILDVDPGHDDAVAMLVAAKHEKLDLRGITVVAGNQVLEKTLRNALNVCSFAGIDVPVYAGQDRPLFRDQVVADDIHGETGLDGPEFPNPPGSPRTRAVDFIIEECLKYDKELVLVPTGPLTNIALALLKEPRIKQGIKEIVLMGGAYGLGNHTPSAEFNIFVDPEAAHIVFESGLPITMVGLDLTHQAKAYPRWWSGSPRSAHPWLISWWSCSSSSATPTRECSTSMRLPARCGAVAHVIDPT